MAGRRFERLERARGDTVPSAPGATLAVASRFGGGAAGPPATGEAPERTGLAGVRFESPPADERLRAFDHGEGQSFVRCALCRADNYVTASRCVHCDTSLLTPEQRSFNEALWRRTRAEKEEEMAAVSALREKRAQGERDQAEAFRRRQALEAELERRRELGLPLDDDHTSGDPVRAGARWLGGLLGRSLVRLLPTRRLRYTALGLLAVSASIAAWRFPRVVIFLVWAALFLGVVVRRRREGSPPRWR